MDYLNDEDYAIAKENGISRHRAYIRMYELGWSKHDAITKPLQHLMWPKYKEQCEQNKVSQVTFYKRVQKGMSPDEASTLPPRERGGRYKNPKLPQEIVQQAAKNGISIYALRQRVYVYRWPVEKAVSTPTDGSKRRKA